MSKKTPNKATLSDAKSIYRKIFEVSSCCSILTKLSLGIIKPQEPIKAKMKENIKRLKSCRKEGFFALFGTDV
jgi:hypothetical protein